MDWLQALPWEVFWFGWGMVALLAGGSLYAVWWAKRNAGAIAAQAPVDVSGLAEGYRLAWGRTLGPDLAAPLTGRPCVWWKAQVWESVRDRDTSGKWRHVWREAAAEESDRPLLFGDGNSVAAVWTWGASAVIPSAWSDWRGQALPPEDRDPEQHRGGAPAQQGIRHDVQGTFGPRFRYIEQIIEKDAPLFALGAAARTDQSLYAPDDGDDDGDRDGDRERDRDGAPGAAEAPDSGPQDDEDDEPGWRAGNARLEVVPASDATIAADMARADWTIGAAKGRPFLVSTEHPDAVGAEQELGAKGGMIMGALFLALALFLLWARLA